MRVQKLTIRDDRVSPASLEIGTEGSVGFDAIQPVFSDSWDNLFIKAVFTPARGKPVEVSYTGRDVKVPVEMFRHAGDGGVIFTGFILDGEVVRERINTEPCVLVVRHTLSDKGANGIPETPDMYEQLRSDMQEDMADALEDALEEAKASGDFNGPKGEPGPKGPAGPPGVYMLGEGEDEGDVPPEYDVVIDPFHEQEIHVMDRGIVSIERVTGDGSPGTVDTYRILYSDDTTTEYTVYNGSDGKNFAILGYYASLSALMEAVPDPEPGMAYGVGLEAPFEIYIFDGVGGIWINNGAMSGVAGEPGKSVEMRVSGDYIQWRREGEAWSNLLALAAIEGEAGVGIQSIERTSGDGSPGTVDEYTITFTDGYTSKFTVTNGTKITVSGTVSEGGSDPVSGDAVFAYVQEQIGSFLTGAS